MAEERSLNDDLDSFAAALSDLVPSPAEFNRDRLIYDICRAKAEGSLAGRRASLRMWQCATGASTLAAVIFAGLWFTTCGNRLIVEERSTGDAFSSDLAEPLQGIDLRSPAARSVSGVDVTYLRQRNRLLADGLETSSTFPISAGESSMAPLTNQQIWDSVLNVRELGG